jgi:hypothetical protein
VKKVQRVFGFIKYYINSLFSVLGLCGIFLFLSNSLEKGMAFFSLSIILGLIFYLFEPIKQKSYNWLLK